jgi:nucleotide-binding universal stress UspA family protein
VANVRKVKDRIAGLLGQRFLASIQRRQSHSEDKIMFEKILVPLDGSAIAQGIMPCVKMLSRPFDSTIVLFHAAEAPVELDAKEAYAKETVDRIRSLADGYMTGVATVLREEGFKVETTVEVGGVAHSITDFAEAEDVDLIAMSTHARAGVPRWMMGSARTASSSPTAGAVGTASRETRWMRTSVLKSGIVPGRLAVSQAVLPYVKEMAKRLKLEVLVRSSTPTTVSSRPWAPTSVSASHP